MKNLKHANFDYRSVFWMLAWSASFTSIMSLVKFLSADISIFMILFLRLLFGFMFFIPFVIKEGIKIGYTKRLPLHFFRVMLFCGALFCTYYAYSHLPIAFATSIGFTAPMMTAVLSMLLLRDKVEWYKWVLISIGYLGVLIMVRPGEFTFDPVIIVALLANLFASCTMIVVRKLSTTESTASMMFYSQSISLVIWAVLAIIFWQTPVMNDILLLCVIGAFGVFSQFCYTHALQTNSPSMVAPFEYTRLIFAVPIGLMLFNEVPTVWTIGGSIVIIFSNFLLTMTASQKRMLSIGLGKRKSTA